MYDFSLKFFKKSILNAFYKTKYIFEKELNYLDKITLKIYHSIGTNIGAFLVHGFKSKIKIPNYCNFKCNDLYCVTCKYIRETSSLNFKNLLLPILSNSNCNSPGIIYIISCNKCNIHYIGESKRKAKDRFAEHLKNILNFKYNIKNSIMNFSRKSEVAINFN